MILVEVLSEFIGNFLLEFLKISIIIRFEVLLVHATHVFIDQRCVQRLKRLINVKLANNSHLFEAYTFAMPDPDILRLLI